MRKASVARPAEDHELNQMVSRVLLAGLTAALALMAIGLVLGVLHPGSLAPQAVPLAQLPGALIHGDPGAFLSLGIVVLLSTPALRVAVLLLGYVQRRQWLFAAISLAVLSVLAISVLLGASE